MIKKTLFFICFITTAVFSFAQPKISGVSFSKDATVYGLYEVSFNLGDYPNPYDPDVIDVYAVFHSPEGKTFRVNGFYFEAYNFTEKDGYEVAARFGDGDGWKVRFTPDMVGDWSFEIHAEDRGGSVSMSSFNGKRMVFKCSGTNAEGFVRKANSKYLKREAFVDGQRQYHSFYPVGPNVAWYASADYNRFKKPYGIYDYKKYIDALTGNANYMRIWLTRYQYLSLYGPEHAIRENGKPVVYFDSELNQKDAAELDFIVSYAADHGITLMPCFFTFGDFRDDSEALEKSAKYNSMPSGWRYNPYHTILGLERPLEFFSDPEAIRITKNLIRYIIARWGYATNIVCWELWNEVGNIFKKDPINRAEGQALFDWHSTMAAMIAEQDPYRHLITTSTGSSNAVENLKEEVFKDLDISQLHTYQNIQKAKSKEQMSHILFLKAQEMREIYPDKPYFMGEYGLDNPVSGIDYLSKDPQGVDIHNSSWSSLFSGSLSLASFWYWDVLSKCNLFRQFKPMMVFCSGLPILSDSFTAETTGTEKGGYLEFPNQLATYYLINASEDTLMGWCQDTAFCYQSLRRLTDEVGKNGHFVNDGVFDPKGYVYTLNSSKRPAPSAKRNTIQIPMTEQPRGTRYSVKWYDTETGNEIVSEETIAVVRRKRLRKVLSFEFPSSIRDTKKGVITNTFGDAVFVLYKIED